MTKDEAKAKAAGVVSNYRLCRDEVGEKVKSIIDQIDQPPGEFSVSELFGHLKEIGRMVELHSTGTWVIRGQYECDADTSGRGPESLLAKLLELAKPPEPQTVTVEMPLAVARCCAEYRDGEVAKACKVALEKAKL